MPNQHATKGITWHPADPTLKPRLEAEAGRHGMTKKALLDEIVGGELARREMSAAITRKDGNSPMARQDDRELADKVFRATKELVRAGGDASQLLPEEVKVLTETGCAVWENGRLLFTQDWAATVKRALAGP
jgi:hypothetical protein